MSSRASKADVYVPQDPPAANGHAWSSENNTGKQRNPKDKEEETDEKAKEIDWWDIIVRALLWTGVLVYIIFAIVAYATQEPAVTLKTETRSSLQFPMVTMCPLDAEVIHSGSVIKIPEEVPATSHYFVNCIAFHHRSPTFNGIKSGWSFMLMQLSADFTNVKPTSFIGVEVALHTQRAITDLPQSNMSWVRLHEDSSAKVVVDWGKPTLLSLSKQERTDIEGVKTTKYLPRASTLSLHAVPPEYTNNIAFVGMRYDDFDVQLQTESNPASATSLFGEIGGFIGIFLGASIYNLINLLLTSMRKVRERKANHNTGSASPVTP